MEWESSILMLFETGNDFQIYSFKKYLSGIHCTLDTVSCTGDRAENKIKFFPLTKLMFFWSERAREIKTIQFCLGVSVAVFSTNSINLAPETLLRIFLGQQRWLILCVCVFPLLKAMKKNKAG